MVEVLVVDLLGLCIQCTTFCFSPESAAHLLHTTAEGYALVPAVCTCIDHE